MAQEWGQRADVMEALIVLSSDVPDLTPQGRDPRWPNLTEAIHRLIDDTSWDLCDPHEDIPGILHTKAEATAVAALVQAVMSVHDRQGPTAYQAWLGDPEWPRVQQLAASTLARLK